MSVTFVLSKPVLANSSSAAPMIYCRYISRRAWRIVNPVVIGQRPCRQAFATILDPSVAILAAGWRANAGAPAENDPLNRRPHPFGTAIA